jgi:hypothetical protein
VDVVVRDLSDAGIKWEWDMINPITSGKFCTGPRASIVGQHVYQVTFDIVEDHLKVYNGSILCSGPLEWFVGVTYIFSQSCWESKVI